MAFPILSYPITCPDCILVVQNSHLHSVTLDFVYVMPYNIIMKEIEIFKMNDKSPLMNWVSSFKDVKIKARILDRIKRLKEGNLGDYKKLDSDLSELRLNFGSGYRIYFHETNKTIVLLISGGDKSTQSKDIKKAKEYLNYWKGQNND